MKKTDPPPSQPDNQRPTCEGDALLVEENYAGAAAVYSDAIKITSTTRHGHQNEGHSSVPAGKHDRREGGAGQSNPVGPQPQAGKWLRKIRTIQMLDIAEADGIAVGRSRRAQSGLDAR